MARSAIRVTEVARIASVSPATVSRVINHPELVSKSTVEQVQTALKQLGYAIPLPQINPESEKKVIIVNRPQGVNPFYDDVIQGAIVSAAAHGYYLIFNYDYLNRSNIDNFCQLISRINASGIITLNQLSEDLLYQLDSIAPLVQCCEYNSECNLPYVSIDDCAAAVKAVNFLISAERNKIAFVNGPLRFKYARKRLEGFMQAMADANLSIPSSWIIQVPEINYDMAYTAVSQLLSTSEKPNAFFAASDVLAAAIINAAHRYKLHIPEDIMVVGFDNIMISTIVRPAITTINQPKFQLGYTACEMLVERIHNPNSKPRSMTLGTELIVRDSAKMI